MIFARTSLSWSRQLRYGRKCKDCPAYFSCCRIFCHPRSPRAGRHSPASYPGPGIQYSVHREGADSIYRFLTNLYRTSSSVIFGQLEFLAVLEWTGREEMGEEERNWETCLSMSYLYSGVSLLAGVAGVTQNTKEEKTIAGNILRR